MNFLVLLGVLFTAVSADLYCNHTGVAKVPVMDVTQLWWYQRGPGYTLFGDNSIIICLVGPRNKKFVRTTPYRSVVADGDECSEDNLYEVRLVRYHIAFSIRSIKQNQYWSCRHNGALWGVYRLSLWEKFYLFVDDDGYHLTFCTVDRLSWLVYQGPQGFLHCSNNSNDYSGNQGFLGWVLDEGKEEAGAMSLESKQ